MGLQHGIPWPPLLLVDICSSFLLMPQQGCESRKNMVLCYDANETGDASSVSKMANCFSLSGFISKARSKISL